MPDEIDKLQEHQHAENERHIAAALAKAAAIPDGVPGECDGCLEQRPRLVRGMCARCRDEHRLP